MKKTIIIILALLMLAGVIAVAPTASAADFVDTSLKYGDFRYRVNEDGTASVLRYVGPEDVDVVVPHVIDGHIVTALGSYESSQVPWWYNYSGDTYVWGTFERINVKSVVVPDTVASICDFAFNCCNLETISLSDSITEIPYYAFCSATKLKSLKIPNGCTSIEQAAIETCGKLETVTIPDSVTYLSTGQYSGHMFHNCQNITDVYFEGTQEKWENEIWGTSGDGINNLKNATIHFNSVINPTVTFIVGEHGTAPEAVDVTKGNKVTKPANPSANGWRFGGWQYYDKDSDGEKFKDYDFNTPVTKSLCLYANWIEDQDATEASETSEGAPDTSETTPDTSETTPDTSESAPDTSESTPVSDKKDISGWDVIGLSNKTYTGKAITQKVVVTNGVEMATVSSVYTSNKDAGTATMIITGTGNYTGMIVKTFKINKAKNPMTLGCKKSATAKAKKKTTIKKAVVVKKAQGKVTYKTNNKKVTVKNGTMTVAKGLKKGKTYKIKVTITVKGNGNYKAKKIDIMFKIKVK